MPAEVVLAIIGGVIVLITIVSFLVKKAPKRIKSVHYVRKWREIQKLCGNKEDWNHAIIHADMLLGEVLEKKRISGKSIGEKLVNVEKSFKSKEEVWNAHKLANSIREHKVQKLKESEVKNALVAFRQALRDLGAI